MKQNDNFWIGLLIGATVPIIGFWLIQNLFNMLAQMNIIDELTSSTIGRRERTLTLVAICCNLLVVNLPFLKKYNALAKGILVASFIYCGLWVYHYHAALFN